MQNIENKIENMDDAIIRHMRNWALPFGRFAIFVVYFWFGILKVLSLSPANPLVAGLLERTLPGVSFGTFIVALGIFEMILGVIFLIPKMERLAIFLLVLHMIMVIMPLFLLPSVTWQAFMVPTLEGQYIIKNILIVALAIVIASHLHSFKDKKLQ
ncbi:MAG: hypothetical protein V4439_02630 [Patescibacteria group bacterium]